MDNPARITLLMGNNEYAIERHILELCAGMGDATIAEINIARFDCSAGIDFDALTTAVNATPFLAERRVVVIANAVAALTGLPVREKFLSLLEKGSPSTFIVWVEDEFPKPPSMKEKHWLMIWVDRCNETARKKQAPVLPVKVRTCKQPSSGEMPRWIESEARRQGGTIEPPAASRLAGMTGGDTRSAALELEKLLTYVKFKRAVTLEDVNKVSLSSAPVNIFNMVDAIGMKDGKTAQQILHQILEEMDVNALWGMVIRQFRLLLQTRELLDGKANPAEIEKNLRVYSFVAQKLSIQARQFSLAELEAIYHKLLIIEEENKAMRLPPEQLKTNPVPLDVALDMLIVELTRN